MRLFLRAGIVLGLAAVACSKDSPSPVDFDDPVAVSADLQSIDSAFDSDVFRSFSTATFMLDPAAPTAMGQVATLLETTRPALKRAGGQAFLAGTLQGRRLQALVPELSVAAAQGQIIPESLYNRVYEWDATLDEYTWQGTTTTGLTGVRFVLYAVGLDGLVVEPVSAIGTLDIIDQSTLSTLQLQVLVRGPGGTPTYLDYTIALTANSQTSATATASGTISNGLSAAANKTLSFDETFTVNQTSIRVNATFALNNPVITLTLNQSLTFDDPIVINADFQIIQPGETIRTVGRITIDQISNVTVTATVYVNGHPVASISGDPSNPATQWVDAGGEPLTVEDLVALDHLFDAFESFQVAVAGLFSPFGTLVTL
ncbi:MAG: hypothetical protein WD773_09215 [Gemmatimonadales bacterium]